jgi:hypothetical protein
MTVAAVKPDPANMMGMAERNRLLASLSSARHIRRAVQFKQHPPHKGQEEYGPKDGNARERIRTVMEDLGHSLIVQTLQMQNVQ